MVIGTCVPPFQSGSIVTVADRSSLEFLPNAKAGSIHHHERMWRSVHSRSPPSGNTSGRNVFCQKFQKELPGLDAPPWPGELGERIYQNISAEAWKMWEERMKMILNEYRLMPWQKEAQQLVTKHMEDFFFGEGRGAAARLRAAAGQRLKQPVNRGAGEPVNRSGKSPRSHANRRIDGELEAAMRRAIARSASATCGARAKMNPR